VSGLHALLAWSLGEDVLPDDDVGHAVLLVTDTLAAAVGAAVEPEVAGAAGASRRIGGDGPSTVWADGSTTTPATAALLNGAASVRLELDEGNQLAANHPCAHTLPALVAVAEEVGSTGRELLESLAAAYEVAVRVGRGVRLHEAVHPFGTAMVCGAAAGVARLRGLGVDEAVRAVLVAAALVPASTQRAATTGATVRNAVTGLTAQAGVLAVELARTGTTGDPQALETVFGTVLGSAFDATHLDAGLGDVRHLRTGYLKLHACSRWNHAPIEATEALLVQHGFGADDVAEVEVATYDPATRLRSTEVPNGFAGKHSIPYNVAARILLRDNGIGAYTDEMAADPGLQALTRRVRVVEDPAMTAAAPAVRAARVRVTLTDGRVLDATEERPPGGPDRPYPAHVLRAKHEALLRHTLPPRAVAPVLAWCEALPGAADVAGLPALLGAR
jgi:2-methylcitrate dehydratase PrpD